MANDYFRDRIKNHLNRNKNPYLLYEAIAAIGIAIETFGGNYSPSADAVLSFDIGLFFLDPKFQFYWPK
jgi:hypothetical protein